MNRYLVALSAAALLALAGCSSSNDDSSAPTRADIAACITAETSNNADLVAQLASQADAPTIRQAANNGRSAILQACDDAGLGR